MWLTLWWKWRLAPAFVRTVLFETRRSSVVISARQLCTNLEDWRRMGHVFRSICQSIQRPNQLQQISGRVAIALLSESKDKQAVPFAAFAETGGIRIAHPSK